MDLTFEIESENWEEVYNLAINGIKKDPLSSDYWFARTVACIALTSPDNDKSKEALESAKKLTETGSGVVNLDKIGTSLNVITKRFSKGKYKSKQAAMTTDKPDNVSYGLQMMSGDFAARMYVSRNLDSFYNLLFCVEELFFKNKTSSKKSAYEGLRNLYTILLQPLNDKRIKFNFESRLKKMRSQVEKEVPGYRPFEVKGGCMVILFALTATISTLFSLLIIIIIT